MNCPPKETISRYLDGELSPPERSEIEAHLSTCEACRAVRRELEGADRALKLFSIREEAPPLQVVAGCPGGDAVAAFADGSIVGAKERMRIARHLAECDSCARKAGEAAAAARLARELEERGLERVPPALEERVRDRLMQRKPVLAGEIAASVKTILKHVRGGLEVPGREFGHVREKSAAISEMRMDYMMMPRPEDEKKEIRHFEVPPKRYHAGIAGPGEGEKKPPMERKPKPRKKPRRKKRRLRKGLDWLFKKEGLQILVRLRGTPAGTIDCRIELTDEAERPLPGVRVALEEADAGPRGSRTGKRGGAAFRDLIPGRYRLVTFHGREIHVNLDLK